MIEIFDEKDSSYNTAMERERLVGEVLRELRALDTADQFMTQASAAALAIHPTDMHAGEILDRQGPMTVGELARAVGISPGAATALVDRLENAGFARRVHDPVNRRRVLVSPTETGAARSRAVFEPLAASSARVIARYSDVDLRLIRDFLRAIQAVVVEHTERLRER